MRQHVWHCSNWGQLQKDAQTQCVTSLSRGKPSGAAEPGPFGGGCIQKQGWGTRCRAHGVYARCLTRTNHNAPKRVADHPDAPLNGIIECGDFKIDLTRRTVAVRDRELDRTSEEVDVLVFLAGHPQSLITPPHSAVNKLDHTSDSANRILKGIGFAARKTRRRGAAQARSSYGVVGRLSVRSKLIGNNVMGTCLPP